MYVSVFEQKAMSKCSMSPAFIMYVSVFEQKAMSKCSMSPALLCTYCTMYVSVFEQKAMSKCSMSPALLWHIVECMFQCLNKRRCQSVQ